MKAVTRRHASMGSSRRKKNLWLLTMVAPGAIWLLLLRYLPMFGVLIAFKQYRAFKPNTFWNNIIKSKWVGLDNFSFLNSSDMAVMLWSGHKAAPFHMRFSKKIHRLSRWKERFACDAFYASVS